MSLGPAAAEFAARIGRPFMPWQAQVADVILEIDPATGEFAYQTVIVTVPRQAGKTLLYSVICEHRALSKRGARVWFTHQSGKDARDWFLNEHVPLLAPFAQAISVHRGAGTERVLWRNSGGLFRPFPPQPDALHGKTSDLVVVDETWAFDLVRGRALDQAVVPTQATRPGAQVLKLSTAGDANSLWLLGSVEAGRAAVEADRRDGLAYFEWSCPDHLDPTNPDSWPLFHPAYDITIRAPAMRAALEQLGPDEFARAYGNRWVSTSARVIPAAAWRDAAEPTQGLPEPGDLVLGFDVAVDRTDASIVAAWVDANGVHHLEVVDWRDTPGEVAARLVELAARWRPRSIAFDAAGPALDVADAATRAGLELMPLKARDYAAACSALLEGLIAEPPGIRYRPHQALDDAAAAATRRALGDAWAWGRRQSAVSLSPLTAATVAHWAELHSTPSGPFRIF